MLSRELLLSIIKELRKPAGDDPKYASLELIKKNADEFFIACNKTFNAIHRLAIKEIVEVENAIEIASKNKMPNDFIEFLEFQRVIWVKINDTLVWNILGFERHLVKRLCFWKKKGVLKHQNLKEHLDALDDINNEDPFVVSILNDATSCVDVTDILVVHAKTKKVSLVEIKAGKVNEEMLSTPMECDRAMYYFLKKYGKKGEQQVRRYLNQTMKAQKAVKLLLEEKGEDPVTKQEMMVQDVGVDDETFDNELEEFIAKARINGSCIGKVDDCLWVGVFLEKEMKVAKEVFSSEIFRNDDGSLKEWLQNFFGHSSIEQHFIFLSQGLGYQIARPLFLLDLPEEDLVDLAFPKLRVLFYLDWHKFALLVKSLGGEFTWSTDKEGRKELAKPIENRCLIVNGRVPIIAAGEVKSHMGAPLYLRMFFDCLKPSCLVKQFIEASKKLPDLVRNTESKE